MVVTETSFPRGGVVQKKPKEETVNFGAVNIPKKRKDKLTKKERIAARIQKEDETKSKSNPKPVEAVSAELLSFRTIREGMIILGCVKAVNPTSVEVALPGRMNGTIKVSSISKTYLALAQQYIENESEDAKEDTEDEYQPLANLFQIGQVVCVKVVKIDTSKENKIDIELSMRPEDVQANFQHQAVSTSLSMYVAIEERQEHGFVVETGVSKLRGFLPETNSDLKVGAVYFCRIKNATNDANASTATFELADTSKMKITQFKEPNVNHILPGIMVSFKVTKVMKDGLQGTIFDENLIGYINEHQLGFANKMPRVAKSFEIGSNIKARVLYVNPLTKIVYLSLNLQKQFKVRADDGDKQQKIYAAGTLIEKAVVSHTGTGGIVLKLPEAKGIISLRSLKGPMKANFDMEALLSKYEAGSVHKIRVLHYDPIDLLHVCSVDAKIINEKYFSCNDVQTGDFVTVTIARKLNDGRHAITLGRIKGFIHPIYLSKATSADRLQPGRKFKCRVLCKNQTKDEIFVTNLKEYMDPASAIATAKTNLSMDSVFIGVVKGCLSDGWRIEFCDYLNGMLYRNQLTANELSTAQRFFVGQVIKVTIKHVRNEDNKKRITVGLADYSADVGVVHQGKISAIQPTGFDVAFLDQKLIGFVPIMYLSDFPSLVHALHRVYQCNDDIEAVGVAQNCYSTRDATDASGNRIVVKKFSEVQVGDVIPAFIKNVVNELIDVHCQIKDFRTTVAVHLNMFVENYAKAGNVTLLPDQKVFVRILAKNNLLKTLTCSARLDDVWPGSFKHTVQMMRTFFKDLAEIEKRTDAKKPIKTYRVGQVVKGVPVESDRVDSNKHPLRTFALDGGVKVYVTKSNDATQKKNTTHKILIVWIDYANGALYGTMLPKYLERCATEQDEESAAQQLLAHRGFKANILLILDDIIIAYPNKWTNRFVYIPTRVHYNDFQPVVTKGISEGSQINVSIIDATGDQFIGMLHNLYELYSKKIDQSLEFTKLAVKEADSGSDTKPEKNNKKRKSSGAKTVIVVDDEEETIADDIELQTPAKKKKHTESPEKATPAKKTPAKKETSAKEETPAKKQTPAKKGTPAKSETPKRKTPAGKLSMKLSQMDGAMDIDESSDEEEEKALPGVTNFWSTDLNALNKDSQADSESSSEDEDELPKKRKLTSKERFDAVRMEEARIRAIEKTLADDSILPTSIDSFDRSVMANPNSSRNWINYIVFHVQANEIDKARAIGQKALKTIDVREQQERLNIWVALLNMELRFGSKDAFNELLKEALLVNEPFKVYSICLKIYADCKQTEELGEMVSTVTKKFRQNPDCWLNAAQAFFEVDLHEKAKSLLNRALSSLSERDHISTISRFAILCNKFGDKNHAHALFEQILVSYPKRVDCWSQYIDILVKGNDFDIARQTLERAVTHKIPMKKMRTLFKKYLEFEQQHGDEASVAKVKVMVANYVHNEIAS